MVLVSPVSEFFAGKWSHKFGVKFFLSVMGCLMIVSERNINKNSNQNLNFNLNFKSYIVLKFDFQLHTIKLVVRCSNGWDDTQIISLLDNELLSEKCF